ncbi:YbhB/YbcL family Raf kinase inhibitor-like protein [Catenovulum maritimum]|uniref:Kinase inhibitor n=1 Tax=Catenovulum maritimum TaxID=1513271 RepID=A0A0J8GUY6_9ALTE|nr:YbhB/YbcL family Raf kinase inhibitor-like protein [Catenovulum maritimum]KMT65109.1 kinase inhibitor [Catenovulum maritimum]
MSNLIKFLPVLSLFCSGSLFADHFTLKSADIEENQYMSKKHEFAGFGCTGEDKSPQLSWSNPPKGTKSFAITVYDPDAPTGSGWWHWQVINIPVSVNQLDTNAGSAKQNQMPTGSKQIQNDYGVAGFGGACPPKGHGTHNYKFTLHALSVEKLDIAENASGALTGYMINANTIETASITALYKR